MVSRSESQWNKNLEKMTRIMIEKLANQTMEDNNVNRLYISPYLDLASDTNTPKDYTNDDLITFD